MRSVQRRDMVKKIRKIMFIDVSKAHLYAPVALPTLAYHPNAVSQECVANCSTGSME